MRLFQKVMANFANYHNNLKASMAQKLADARQEKQQIRKDLLSMQKLL